MTVDEIAAIQGVSASAVKSRLARGRDRLRAHYGGTAVPVAIPGDST
jgi:DNA-directed RNA polymerase specialized sigma24 family protein